MSTALRSAHEAVSAWTERGGTPAAALEVVDQQAEALDAALADDAAFARLVSIAQRTIDPWFATDWPETFDPLMLVLPLCRTFDWQCATCPIGRQQEDRACAHPEVPVTRLGAAISGRHRTRAQTELSVLRSMLRHASGD